MSALLPPYVVTRLDCQSETIFHEISEKWELQRLCVFFFFFFFFENSLNTHTIYMCSFCCKMVFKRYYCFSQNNLANSTVENCIGCEKNHFVESSVQKSCWSIAGQAHEQYLRYTFAEHLLQTRVTLNNKYHKPTNNYHILRYFYYASMYQSIET